MKYIGMPMGMWVLFGKSFEDHLITGFVLGMPERPDVKRLTAHWTLSESTRLPPAARTATADIKNGRKCR